MKYYDLYADQMYALGHGLAVWEPEPDGTYDKVEIADVGYMFRGKFCRLFNVGLPIGHPENTLGVPNGYEPLVQRSLGTIETSLPARQALWGSDIKAVSTNINASPHVPFLDACAALQVKVKTSSGSVAMLLTGHEMRAQDAFRKLLFERYIKMHHASWLEFANHTHSIGLRLEDLMLVSGYHVTSDFATLAFTEGSREVDIELALGFPSVASGSLSVSTSSSHTLSPAFNCGPRGIIHGSKSGTPFTEQNSEDSRSVASEFTQCVFLRRYRMKKWGGVIPRIIKAGAGPHELDSGEPPQGEQGSSRIQSSSDVPADDVEVVSDTTPTHDPTDPVLDYILSNSDASFALVHDDDLNWLYRSLSTDMHGDANSILLKMTPKIKIEDGVGRLSTSGPDISTTERGIRSFAPFALRPSSTPEEVVTDLTAVPVSLVAVKLNSKNSDVRAAASKELVHRAKNDKARREMFKGGTIGTLVDMLKSEDMTVLFMGEDTLLEMAQYSDVRGAMLNANVGRLLVKMLTSEDITMRSKAGEILARMARYNQTQAATLTPDSTVLSQINMAVDLDTLRSMRNLASRYWDRWQWKELEELAVHVLAMSTIVLEAEHPDTLKSMGNLASVYRNQGWLRKATELQNRVLNVSTRVLGPEHPDTLRSMGHLALMYQDRRTTAQKLQVQVMQTSTRVLGVDHPDTLMSMGNLATTYASQERLERAEELQVQVMEASTRVLGAEHPHTLMSMGNLAETYVRQRRLERAEELQIQVMEVSKRVFGAEHPDTLMSIGNVATMYLSRGQLERAEELQVQIIEASTRVLGAKHPQTLMSMGNLAGTYVRQRRLERAEKLQVQVMKASQRVLGVDHPNTLSSMRSLASTFRMQERHEKSQALDTEVREMQARMLETGDFETRYYWEHGGRKEGQELLGQVMEASTMLLAKDHPESKFWRAHWKW